MVDLDIKKVDKENKEREQFLWKYLEDPSINHL